MSNHPDVIQKRRRQYPWTSELDLLLEQGYRSGLIGQRAAIDWIQRRTGWPRQACWDRARKLGLAQKRSGSPKQWTPIEEQRLLNLAGCKNVRFIAERLHRSVAAVRKRLRRLGETSTRVREGLTKNQLAELIGGSPKHIPRKMDRCRMAPWRLRRKESRRRLHQDFRQAVFRILAKPPRTSTDSSLESRSAGVACATSG